MIERHDEEGEIRAMLQKSMAGDEPPTELQRKLQLMAREASKPKRSWWTSRKAIMAFTAAAAAMVMALTMTPTQAVAKSYDSLVAAAQKVNAFQFSIDSIEPGQKREKFTVTGADGKFAIKATGEEGIILQFDRDSLNLYDAKQNVVTKFKLGGFVDAKMIAQQMQRGLEAGFKHLDLKKMLADYEKRYGKDHIRISRVRTENGRSIYDAVMEAPNDPERVRVYVDAATDLPYRIIAERRHAQGGWNVASIIDLRYGAEVDRRNFGAEIPADAKTTEVDIQGLFMGAKQSVNSLGPLIRKFDQSWKGVR
jgi:hypothetical protein